MELQRVPTGDPPAEGRAVEQHRHLHRGERRPRSELVAHPVERTATGAYHRARMPTDVPDPATELQAIERARDGEHDAFVRLYRQDAPPAWRLGLALTGDALSAADAVALAFARVLVPSGPGARRSEVPFRLRLLTATRHVVLDQGHRPHRGEAPRPSPARGRPR